MSLTVIILAAGRGQRMLSALPKVLHPLGGKPLLTHIINTALSLSPKQIHVVYGNGSEQVRNTLADFPINWVKQKEQLGTAHAVSQAIPLCDDDDQVLILYGDVPLISTETLQKLLNSTPDNHLGLVVAQVPNPGGLGRIIRNKPGNIIAIVEQKDATEEQLTIQEINTGILTTNACHLKTWLPQIKNSNQQGEYYLTDIVAIAVNAAIPINDITAQSIEEIQGVNDRAELAHLERYYQCQQAQQLMKNGVRIMDPARLDIRGDVNIAPDVTLDINVILSGQVSIGKNSIIGANVQLTNVVIGENVIIHPMSSLEGAVIYNDCQIGPFARIRPETFIEKGAKIGNFVEIKKTRLGENSKALHLTYLGNSTIGMNVNIGAGTITCNYDGVNKWTTEIGDNAFIGSNSTLVAPLKIGQKAYIGAGSTINTDAPPEQLTLGRARQCTIEHWQKKL